MFYPGQMVIRAYREGDNYDGFWTELCSFRKLSLSGAYTVSSVTSKTIRLVEFGATGFDVKKFLPAEFTLDKESLL